MGATRFSSLVDDDFPGPLAFFPPRKNRDKKTTFLDNNWGESAYLYFRTRHRRVLQASLLLLSRCAQLN